MRSTDAFAACRNVLLRHRDDHGGACRSFTWPELTEFNWAIDWFDVHARGNTQRALWLIDDAGSECSLTYEELSARSNQVANWLRKLGVKRGERMLIMLGNVIPLWEIMLAAAKLGAVVIPATTQLTREDIADRFDRGAVKYVATDSNSANKFDDAPAGTTRILVGEPSARREGWTTYDPYAESVAFVPDSVTKASDPLLLYFTSGTTAKPKLVMHTHESYPVGHLSTMYWIGLREGDVHMNVSSPGWAKHAWSCFFAPFNAGATVFVYSQARFDAARTLEILRKAKVNTLCAPPTVWRMLLLGDLGAKPEALRELVSAGEPLNPEVIERVNEAWGLTIRDGFGQTETSCQIGNSPGQPVKHGSMGRPLPGFDVVLLDHEGNEAAEGEIALRLSARRPTGLMAGYLGDEERSAAVTQGGYYRTGDEASRDEDGYFHYVGRGDDVFKSSDYRISPFELESVLIEHPAVAEAAVVPSPDPVRLSVPKAFVVLRPEHAPTSETAASIFEHVTKSLAPFKRVRRLEFTDLPKTISGKIRRVQLRNQERDRVASGARGTNEFWLDEIVRK
ncbi:Acetyl-coenzyme A synthetase [Labilithrix luteola]|uniref:Acetyl-coenzyme A synthetase n=1 Tax=Labilithrix luteola TaxID=1391654 RepID=A0A0K1Q4Y2_9BACT|nr:AMP-binding protein [Labilithrix luteola]AKV00707.1 Acetyl-coenzyme A synthetase [Labilithrix luteola]